ncbi:MAG: metal-dependent hydrolase [Variovorax sp.]
MDSLTQIVLGGAVAAAVVPAAHRRRALIAGAVLGTLPDLDGIPLALIGADAVTAVTWHRGPSHSLLVLAPFALVLWLALRRWWAPVRAAPRPWLAAILLALVTHPLLDAFTVYGTQLLWPLPSMPVMWSSIFIVDPLYTLPLLVAFIGALWAGARLAGGRLVVWGLVLSSSYLAWSLAAKATVDSAAAEALAQRGLADAPRFSVPTPLNTLLWRVVVMTPDGFLEGQRSLVADHGPMTFKAWPSDTAALRSLRDEPGVARLLWFTSGFMKAQAEGDTLVLSDLRMGAEPDYTFSYRIAVRNGAGWRAIPIEGQSGARNAQRQLAQTWQRIWRMP